MTDEIKHPCWRYRVGSNGVEKHLFEDLSLVPSGEGWEDSPAKFSGKADDVDDIPVLRAEAESLGVDVDKRWKETRLKQEIEKARAKDSA